MVTARAGSCTSSRTRASVATAPTRPRGTHGGGRHPAAPAPHVTATAQPCGTLAGVTSAARRRTAALVLGLTGTLLLSSCRSDPGVAAYVGQGTVTTAELDRAVEERLADPGVAAFAAADETAFTRQVLGLLVQEDVYAEVAERYDVQVSDAEVQQRIGELLEGGDPDQVYDQLAQENGVSRRDVDENVRQQLLRTRVAEATGAADLSEEALQEQYAGAREGLGQIELGVITVPDQATADAVLAQLTLDPAAYPAVAASYAGGNTLPAVQPFAAADVPQVLLPQVSSTQPGSGFTLPVPEAGGVVVTFVQGISYPAFEEVRDQLADQAAADAADAGAAAVADVQEDLDVRLNPRYGVLDGTDVVAGDSGVVDILGDSGDAAADPATVPDGTPAGG